LPLTPFPVQSNLTRLTKLASNTYSLETMVSFLEAALSSAGHAQPAAATSSRGALKKRFRELRLRYERLLMPSWDAGLPVVPAPEDRISSGVFLQGSYACSTCVVGLPADVCDVDEVLTSWVAPPLVGSTRATRLDVALRIDRDSPESFFESLMTYWARRHEVTAKTVSPDKRPRRRRALDRLFLALMRFVFGFFGSHKVDARNNP
jgi:hypothetical protein